MRFAAVCHRASGSGQRLQKQLFAGVCRERCQRCPVPACARMRQIQFADWFGTAQAVKGRFFAACFGSLPEHGDNLPLAILPSLSGGGELEVWVLPARGSIPPLHSLPFRILQRGWSGDKAVIATAIGLECASCKQRRNGGSAPFTTLNITAEHGCNPGHLPSRDSSRDDPI